MTQDAYQNTHKGDSEIIILRFDINSSKIEFCTFIGGDSGDSVLDFEISENLCYIAGNTKSSGFPITPLGFDRTYSGEWEGYFLVYNLTGNSIKYSTFIGGSDVDSISDILLL